MQEETLELLILSDLHYTDRASKDSPVPEREGFLGKELAVRAVRDARRQFSPDALVLLGDLVDDGTAPGAQQDLQDLGEALHSCFEGPILLARGNHDLEEKAFGKVLGASPGLTHLKGISFITFWDSWNESDEGFRNPEAMAVLEEAAAQPHPIVVFQHNPLHPQIDSNYPFMLTSAGNIMSSYRDAGVFFSLSGHYHPGQEPIEKDGVTYTTIPALCEFPYPYLRASIRGRSAKLTRYTLGLPSRPRLMDLHCHTEFAYCAQDVTVDGVLERMRALGLEAVAFAEHAGQLYLSPEGFWSATHIGGRHLLERAKQAGHARMEAFQRQVLPRRSDNFKVGLEVELDQEGKLTLLEEDEEGWDHLVGAVHWLPPPWEAFPQEEAEKGFMATVEGLLSHPIDVLAHPFRFFEKAGLKRPAHLYRPVAKLLADTQVAAEINYHTNDPDPNFFACCLEEGARISLGSDSHLLYEVADFQPHLRLLKKVAPGQTLEDILFRI